jgi:hypothetical protein
MHVKCDLFQLNVQIQFNIKNAKRQGDHLFGKLFMLLILVWFKKIEIVDFLGANKVTLLFT